MFWFLFALGIAICNADFSHAIMHFLKEIDRKLLAAGTNLTASIILLLFS